MSTPKGLCCAKCGAELAAFATEGFCSACLLERGLASETAAAPPPFSRFGDYELIEEIARGGMGVVYKARQLSLGRIVAVKMILSGQFASAIEMQRFRAEARATAALQHPGIVSIHEVGEYEGLLYFSMDFVDGRNLAQIIRDGPWSAARAARCVREIAEAIHYAHEHGVLHRDLKPSNVLIEAAGKPRVTDFGLAKQLTEHSPLSTTDPQLTLSGQVLGSPNFMPPEQAAGKHRELTPASDVYSLGALLYHLLTGRAPFLADSIPATLRLVSEAEPVAPRLLVPTVPRDLETICLKCLEKKPSCRYASAHDLAKEIERFLNDAPILAHPYGRTSRLWRWCRRKPALSTLGASTALLLLTLIVGAPLIMSRGKRAEVADREIPWTVNYSGLINLASVLQKNDRLDEACDALTRALRLALANPSVPEDVRNDTFLKRSKLLEDMGRHVEAHADFLRAKNIPARDPRCPPGAIDLTAYYNAGLTKDWHGESPENTLSNLPSGVQQFKGVQFDVRGLIQLASERRKSWKDSIFPRAVTQIKVGRSCERLHFLHAASERPHNQETAVGSYIIHFADQQKWEIPLVYGRDLRDWWAVGDEHREAKEAVIAWEGSNAAAEKLKCTLRLFKSTWTNPLPYAEVDTIDFVSTMSGPAPFLIAITLE